MIRLLMCVFGGKEGGLTNGGKNCQNICSQTLRYYQLNVNAYSVMLLQKNYCVEVFLFIANLVMTIQKVMMTLLGIYLLCIFFRWKNIWLVLARKLLRG